MKPVTTNCLGCYDDGYEDGYADGARAGNRLLEKEIHQQEEYGRWLPSGPVPPWPGMTPEHHRHVACILRLVVQNLGHKVTAAATKSETETLAFTLAIDLRRMMAERDDALAALKDARDIIRESYRDEALAQGYWPTLAPKIRRLDEAIAKAEGK